MESLSRPPHRRKHSTPSSTTTTATPANIFSSSFSFKKNPYDDVLLSKGGGRKGLEVREYSEIFAGASSIPVLDISGLDERAGRADSRNSKLDYSDIFGGFRNDDVFVPYEKLLHSSSAKKTKARIPAEVRPDLQGSGSLHSSRKAKMSSGESSDQSDNGVKQQFNVSFNRTNQGNSDASGGKTHIAQLHAIPGFTEFVDGTRRLDKTKDDKLPSLKREVSRTWSFSAKVEPVKDKSLSSSEKPQIPGNCHNANEVDLKSQFLKVPPPSSCPSNLSGNKDLRQKRTSNFASKEDAPQKIAGDCSPPFLSGEFDENSVDAVSAAALKKAIDQAQESIRIAKMIMEKKKEGYQDGSKPRPTSRLKVSDKETKIDCEAYGSKDKNAREEYEELDPTFTVLAGINGEFTPSLSHSDTIINAENCEVERVWENAKTDNEHGEAFAGGSKLFASNCSQSERLHIDENVKLEKLEKNVEAPDMHREAKDFPGLVANAVCSTIDLEPGKVDNTNNSNPSMCKLASNSEGLDIGNENFDQRKVTVHHTKEAQVVPELVERAPNTSQGTQGMEKSVEEYELCRPTFDHAKEPKNMVERVLRTSQMSSPEHDKVVDEAGENLSISHEGGVNKHRENETNGKEKHGKKPEECEQMLNVEDSTLRSEFNNLQNVSCNEVGNESLEQEEMGEKSNNVSEWKEKCHSYEKPYDDEISGTQQNEDHLWFDGREQLKGAFSEEIKEREPNVFPEIGEIGKNIGEAHEPEIDRKKQNHADDGGEPKLPKELMQNKVEERHANTTEYEAAATITMEANHCAEVQKRAAWDAEETDNTLGGGRKDAEETDDTLGAAGRSEDNQNECQFQEAAYEEDIDEAVDLSSSDTSTIFEAHTSDTTTIICETQEACDVDLNNKVEEHQKPVRNYKEEDTLPEFDETVSAIDNDEKAEQSFDLQDNEMLRTDSLHRSASEEIFVENKLNDDFECLSSDDKAETVGVMYDSEENLPEDEDISRTTSDIHDAAQEAVKINRQDLTEALVSDIRTADFDLIDVRQVVEQTSKSDDGSVSGSSFENIDGLSAHETEKGAESARDKTSKEEELKDEMISDERKCAEEPSEGLCFHLHSEPKEMDKPIETERAAETGLNMEKNEENLAGTSPLEERDAKEGAQNFERNDQQQRIEAIKRGRERQKDRIAVERAIREARERAFAEARERAERAAAEKAAAEARERAERAAAEKAAAEARQRGMAEAQEKVEKASVVKQPVDKASTEAKLRAERAAVERATAEVRARALEKAMSQKISSEARSPADGHPAERLSSSSRNKGLKHSFSSSDLESGMNTESAQRRKARLERHQRIMERAAKALAEKNMRDLLAQKEQAERNRLAESLDADIKRWATGKEGNLRALLSTLQYILGPDSGWQPISLTEIITTAAVKKAYRKATLCVHPDKLQQRGASVQQKYICEKVFDLLKAAWNRFNSDER